MTASSYTVTSVPGGSPGRSASTSFPATSSWWSSPARPMHTAATSCSGLLQCFRQSCTAFQICASPSPRPTASLRRAIREWGLKLGQPVELQHVDGIRPAKRNGAMAAGSRTSWSTRFCRSRPPSPCWHPPPRTLLPRTRHLCQERPCCRGACLPSGHQATHPAGPNRRQARFPAQHIVEVLEVLEGKGGGGAAVSRLHGSPASTLLAPSCLMQTAPVAVISTGMGTWGCGRAGVRSETLSTSRLLFSIHTAVSIFYTIIARRAIASLKRLASHVACCLEAVAVGQRGPAAQRSAASKMSSGR
jgi:hypothetical protein